MSQDIRWQQRFANYQKAFKQIKDALVLSEQRDLSPLEKQGLIQAFEYTHDLAWKTMKDFLEHRGSADKIYGSKDATKQAFNVGIIGDGETWMQMIQSRNQTSHTYNEEDAEEIVDEIFGSYYFRFVELEAKLAQLLELENNI